MAKKKKVEEIKIKTENKYDLIVPTHFVDWKYFTSNVKSWLDYLPLNKVYIGNNNQNEKDFNTIKEFLERYHEIEFVDQRGIKTLGMQIADLMKRTEGELFLYNHADVRIVKHSILVMEAFMEEDVGIVESERVQYDYINPKSYPDQYPYYAFRDRSFSGFQMFRRAAIQEILDKIEDDYIYRNEDIIFQNACEEAGYKYEKALSALHVHTCSSVNHKWTPQGEFTSEQEARAKTFDMQIRGLVKYCSPTKIAVDAWRDAFGICCAENNTDLFDFVEGFVRETNPAWEPAIKKTIKELLRFFVWRR